MEPTTGVAAQTEQAQEEKDTALRHHHERIRNLIGGGKLAEASAACDAASAIDPSNADTLFLKALALYLQGDHHKAEPLIIEALAANSFSVEYYTLLSGIYLRKGDLEEANCVADHGLAIQPGHIPTLQVKALALIRLFRLQDAQSVMQRMQRLRQEAAFMPEAYSIADDDPEVLFEQALTIDPFKTKQRLESLDSVKGQTGSFRFVKKVLFAERNNTILGLAILAGLIMTVAYFFRENATYKSFSLLILAMLLAAASQKGALSVSTNMPLFLPGAFRKFLQRKDIRIAVRGVTTWVIILVAFAAWHYLKSYAGLVVALAAAGYFSILPDKFSDGRSLAAFSIPKPKRKKTESKPQPSMTNIPLEEAAYHSLYHVLRKKLPGSAPITQSIGSILKYGLLFLAAYPVLFFIVRLAGPALNYKIMLIPELAVLFGMQLVVSTNHLLDLPLFFPAGARKFIPPRARRSGYVMVMLQVLLLGSFALWLAIDNAHVLWISGVLLVVIVRKVFSLRTRDEEATLPKAELVNYIRQHHKAFKQASADA